ncbi:MAG TPA: sugar ABC transporter permease [Chloroflexia bacterium]|nr:sugar ABC transporter permease [Chloroflexia bacterium]
METATLDAAGVNFERKRSRFYMAPRTRMAYLMVLPALLIIAVIAFYPIGVAFWFSLHDMDLRFPQLGQPFIGIDNYTAIFSEGRIWDAFRFTTLFALISVGIEFVLGMLFATVMNRAFAGRAMVRAIILIPWALTTVVSARMWGLIYNNEYGVLNSILRSLGILKDNLSWTTDENLAFWSLIGAEVWKATPFVALILLAGMQVIPHELYEAAKVDGAAPYQSFLSITLPALRGTILVALLFRTIDAARVFDLVYVLTGGGPGTSTESLNIYTYKTLFESLNFGQGSAQAMITFGYIMLIALLYLKVLGGRKSES